MKSPLQICVNQSFQSYLAKRFVTDLLYRDFSTTIKQISRTQMISRVYSIYSVLLPKYYQLNTPLGGGATVPTCPPLCNMRHYI